jgi:hypothetical protein
VKRVAIDDPAKFAEQGVQVGDTLIMIEKVFVGDDGRIKRQRHFQKTIVSTQNVAVADFETVDKIDHAAARTQAAEKASSGKKRDVLYYQSSESAATDGKVVKKAADKYGWGVAGEAGARIGNGIGSLTAAVGPSYSWSWGRVDGMFRVARSKYSYNATDGNADQPFTTFGLRVGGDVKLFSFDDYSQWNLYIGGGAGWDFYWTDSKEDQYNGLLKSEGSDPYPFARVTLSYRWFATGNEAYLRLGWEQNPITIQNEGKKHIDCFSATLGFNLGLLRHWVSTK